MDKITAAAYKQLNKPLDLHKMPKWKARVEIAKDVIAALDAKKIVASNTYLYLRGEHGHPELRDALKTASKCEVCAIGSVLVATVARVNDFRVEDFDDGIYGTHLYDIKEKLVEWFSLEQLQLMEIAFEGSDCGALAEIPTDQYKKAVDFGDRLGYDNDTVLRAIMQNIIDNKGAFKP